MYALNYDMHAETGRYCLLLLQLHTLPHTSTSSRINMDIENKGYIAEDAKQYFFFKAGSKVFRSYLI